MRRTAILILTLVVSVDSYAQSNSRQQGTIIRMRMTDCLNAQHGFMAAMSGAGKADATASSCPEYVLLADRVVYVISGKSSDQLIPLAESTRFRLVKSEMLIRVDDAPKEVRFHIKAMVLRPEWDRTQMLEQAEASAMITRHLDPGNVREQ